MSSSGSGSTASFSSGNAQQAPQAQQQPQQPSARFIRGRAFFARLQANEAQEYRNFKRLGED